MNHRRALAGLFAFLILTSLSVTNAADEPTDKPKEEAAQAAKDAEADRAKATPEEKAVTRRDTVTVSGRRIAYAVTPGTLTLRDDEGAPVASMFYVAYVADRAKDAAERPVTFFFNGGPGSSTMWLHMGSFAPVRIETPTTQTAGPAPFHLVPNASSLIDRSDLVFLDAIGTGLSRPLGKAKGPDFWGVDPDIDAFAKGIQRYLTISNRWNSPQYILGESYGTLRAAGLVQSARRSRSLPQGVAAGSESNGRSARCAIPWYRRRLADRIAGLRRSRRGTLGCVRRGAEQLSVRPTRLPDEPGLARLEKFYAE